MKLTQLIIATIIVALLGYEGWTLVNNVPHDTISETIWQWAETTPVIGFFAGLLCGHWFWPKSNKKDKGAVDV